MKQALGLVEIQGLSTAVVVADTMAKAANIRILEIENTKGLGYMTIKVAGDVGAVNAAVNAGRQIGTENRSLVSWKVIPRPSDYVEHTFCDPRGPGPGSPCANKEKEKAKDPQTGPGKDAAAKTHGAEAAKAGTEEVTGEVPEITGEAGISKPETEVSIPESIESIPQPEQPEPEQPEHSAEAEPDGPEEKAETELKKDSTAKNTAAEKKSSAARRKK